MDKIIFATGNEGKMKEVRMILEDLGLPVLSLKDAGITADVEENGTTFEGKCTDQGKGDHGNDRCAGAGRRFWSGSGCT